MRLRRNRLLATTATALLVLGALCTASIRAVDLRQLVAGTDDALYGTILGREVIRIDHETDGVGLYFTHLTLEGRSLVSGETKTVTVTYPGGVIDEKNGAHNSEAPSEDDVKSGNRVVVFYGWEANMGGDLAGNALSGSHGGLFRTAQGKHGTVVQGRGDGYAIERNTLLNDLDARITKLHEETHKGQQGR